MTKIREFKPSDASEIVRLHREYAEYFEEIEITEEFILNLSGRIDFKFFVTSNKNDNIVGFVGVLFHKNVGRGEIGPIGVDSKHKKGRLGTILVTHAFDYLRKQGISRVIARVKAMNEAALEFFKSLSFREEGYFENYTKKGEDVIQLVRFL